MARQRFPLLTMLGDTRMVSRRDADRLVASGEARWRSGKSELVSLVPEPGREWKPRSSAGYTVLQLVND